MASQLSCLFFATIIFFYSGGNAYIEITGPLSSSLGSRTTLTCSLKNDSDYPIAVRWQKENASRDNRDLGMFFPGNPPYSKIYERYTGKINISQTNMRETTVTFFNTSAEDAGCFLCVFYCSATSPYVLLNKTCVTVFAAPTVFVSTKDDRNQTNVTCTATGLPAPLVQWLGHGPGVENSTQNTTNKNGTVSVSSTLYFKKSSDLGSKPYYCVVELFGNITNSITWNTPITPTPPVDAVPRDGDSRDARSRSLISGVSIATVVLIVLILLVIYYYHTKKPDQHELDETQPPGYKKLPET
nr:glycoprotein vOX2-2A [Elephant endotheliotropic herpesvirus 5A]